MIVLGVSFANNSSQWKVPTLGGTKDISWWDIRSNSSTVGDDQWSTWDINGDGRPDLVSHATVDALGGGVKKQRVHGYGSSPHWQVYLNIGR